MLFALCFGVWCCSMAAGMVVCLAYLMSGVVCKPFRFFTVALCVGRVVCFGCLWKDEERFVPRPLFFCVF